MRVYDLCVYFMTRAPEGSNESALEKHGIEPATPGLQGIALIYYTTAASFNGNGQVKLIIVGTPFCLNGFKRLFFSTLFVNSGNIWK